MGHSVLTLSSQIGNAKYFLLDECEWIDHQTLFNLTNINRLCGKLAVEC